jgi:hypothetical protein
MKSGVILINSIRQSGWFQAFTEFTMSLFELVAGRLDRKAFGAVLCCAALAFLVAIWRAAGPFSTDGFTPEQISYLSMPDTRVQTGFYFYLCVLVFAGGLALGLSGTHPRRSVATLTSDVTASWPHRDLIAVASWAAYVFLLEPKLDNFLLAIALWYVCVKIMEGHVSERAVGLALAVAVVLFFVLPAMVGTPVNDRMLWWMDIHWSAVIGHGLVAENLHDLEIEAFSGYGILFNAIILAARSLLGCTTLAEIQAALIAGNFLFCSLTYVVIRQRVGSSLAGTLSLVLLVLFSVMVTGFTLNLIFPNLLPIRFLLFPLTLLLAHGLARLEWPVASLLFGAALPLGLFYNFETGLICVLGLGFALFLQTAKRGLMALVGGALLGMAGAAISSAGLVSVLFAGEFALALEDIGGAISAKLLVATSGYGGLKIYFFPPFLIIMTHTIVLFARHLIGIRDKAPYTPVEFQSATIIGLIIAVAPYIMNRFHVWNMWTPALLYALLVLPGLQRCSIRERRIRSFILIVLVLPFIFGNPFKRLLSDEVAAAWDRTFHPCIGGIEASPGVCSYVAEKSRALEKLSETAAEFGWMSGLATTIGRNVEMQPTLPEKSPFFFGHSERNRQELIRQIKESGRTSFAVDNVGENNPAGIPVVVATFQKKLLQDAGFTLVSSGPYWNLMRKKD